MSRNNEPLIVNFPLVEIQRNMRGICNIIGHFTVVYLVAKPLI